MISTIYHLGQGTRTCPFPLQGMNTAWLTSPRATNSVVVICGWSLSETVLNKWAFLARGRGERSFILIFHLGRGGKKYFPIFFSFGTRYENSTIIFCFFGEVRRWVSVSSFEGAWKSYHYVKRKVKNHCLLETKSKMKSQRKSEKVKWRYIKCTKKWDGHDKFQVQWQVQKIKELQAKLQRKIYNNLNAF